MKLAIMQPYFFPYLGYFSLIKHTDNFILLDTVQFIRHGWINRNRVPKQNEGWVYITVPLKKHSRDSIIKNIEIIDDNNWKDKIIAQLQYYKKRAPFFKQTINIVQTSLDLNTKNITKLNQNILKVVCNYFGINRDFPIFSEMNLIIEEPNAPDEWALNICKALGNVDEYWNPIGGKTFFDTLKYIESDIKLYFHEIELKEYKQYCYNFEPSMSIIDVMMFNSAEEINRMLNLFSIT